MDDKPSDQQSSSDDQELAKVLAGVTEQIENQTSEPTGFHFDEGSSPSGDAGLPPPPPPPLPSITTDSRTPLPSDPPAHGDPASNPPLTPPSEDHHVDPALEGIKKDALNELRPLVDKLNVSPDEKFDTYLLLLRSTDDKSLLTPAYEAARAITDEARRAQALLDVIKEIDYLSHNQPAAS